MSDQRLIRIPRRSAPRLLILGVSTIFLVTLTATSVMSAIGVHWIVLIPVAAVLATFWVFTLRAWTVGTFVNDTGLLIVGLFGSVAAPWAQVRAVEDRGGRVDVELRDGRVISTHIARRGVDLLGSAEAYDMAKLQLRGWAEQR